ncbi:MULTISPECIES: FecR family protein [Sphingomonas]|uniref:Iron dicitrate transport regulator FecR n=1 Tax=Edaphosphingomonas fennica TaxID=114404 RepID=A0A2T4I0B3_9SPHN|nr:MULTISPECIES: FecR domain-containing protein [Sphingomonas]MDX3883106.1 FecR domain-containing protein [Sphingomonas sp.]PTD22069.1 iron dicitrate transport regulator FecR [Sphingomonas fennica]
MNGPVDTTPPSRDEQAVEWCIALAEGHLAGEEQRQFDAWVADPDNARALDEAVRLWQAAESAANLPELIHIRSAALESYRRANSRRWTGGIAWNRPWAAALAAVLVAMLFTGLLWLRDAANTYATGIGERRVAMLADGSKLTLDGDTEVKVSLQAGRRALTLVKGRAKFDVAKDPLRPFSVAAADKIVVATGTSFSVELLGDKVHVVLLEGHVAMLTERDGRTVPQMARARHAAVAADQILQPGGELVAQVESLAPAVLTQSEPVGPSWEAGLLNFDDEPLATAVARMNRYSRQQLVIADARIAGLKVNGVFAAGDVETFIEGVSVLDGVRATRTGEAIVLRRN